jgi:hypothetical protein
MFRVQYTSSSLPRVRGLPVLSYSYTPRCRPRDACSTLLNETVKVELHHESPHLISDFNNIRIRPTHPRVWSL